MPFIRGLDSILWSIYKDYHIGVTAHLINEKIDAGFLVLKEKIRISKNDNIESLYEKNYQLQLYLLLISLNLVFKKNTFKPLAMGEYNHRMSQQEQLVVIKKLNQYIDKYAFKDR